MNGCVDTVLTGWRGHISPTVSGGSSGSAQPSFRFDYSDARLMGVTSLPLHNLGERGWAVIVLPGFGSPGGKSSSGCAVAYCLAAVPPAHLFTSSCQRGNITVCKLAIAGALQGAALPLPAHPARVTPVMSNYTPGSCD